MKFLEKARESLEAARLCRREGHLNRAVACAYYASLQAVRHELDRLEMEPLSEGWTGGVRWEHQTVIDAATEYLGMPEELTDNLRADYSQRVLADYTERETTTTEADGLIEHAHVLLDWIRAGGDAT